LWGGGVMATAASPYVSVLAEDAFFRGLAGEDGRVLPAAYAEFADSTLIVIDARQGWESLEQRWFTGLARALKAGRLNGIKLHLATVDEVQTFSVSRRDLWRFWRRTKPVPEYLNTPPG
jgi:hypothetical protein